MCIAGDDISAVGRVLGRRFLLGFLRNIWIGQIIRLHAIDIRVDKSVSHVQYRPFSVTIIDEYGTTHLLIGFSWYIRASALSLSTSSASAAAGKFFARAFSMSSVAIEFHFLTCNLYFFQALCSVWKLLRANRQTWDDEKD